MKFKATIFTSIALALLIPVALTNTANAQDLYVGASLGTTSFDGSQFHERNTAWGAQLGLDFGRYLSVELGYTDYQEFDSRVPGQFLPSPKSLSLSGVVRYPVFNRLEVFAKAGYTRLDIDIESANPFYSGSNDENNAIYGLGINFLFSENWKIRATYERTDLNLGNIPAGGFFARSAGKLDLVSAGLVWSF